MDHEEQWNPRAKCLMFRRPWYTPDPDGRCVSRPVPLRLSVDRETIPISQAVGRVLTQDVLALQAVPLWNIAGVWGTALNAADTKSASPQQPLQLENHYGHYPGDLISKENRPRLGPGERLLVRPADRLPDGADAVLPEWASEYAGTPLEQLDMKIIRPVQPGQGVLPAGGEIAQGMMLAEAGARLRAHDIAALAMAGVNAVEVMPRPRVAVFSVHDYYQSPAAVGSTWAPDALTPIVLALLAQWGVGVTTLRHFSNDPGRSPKVAAGLLLRDAVEELTLDHDLTIQVGRSVRGATNMSFFGGRPFWTDELVHPSSLNFNPHADGWKHDSSGPWIRPIGGGAAVYCLDKANVPGRVGERQATSHLFVSLEGLPLTVFAGMYLTVRRLLDALEGVDTKRVDPAAAYPRNPLGAGEERARRMAMERAISEQRRKPDYNPRAQPQGVRWLDGVLAAPAPRQPYGPWLQLARFDHSVPGRMGLRVLPSEEWRVGSLLRAEAMVAIERGETELAEGTPVQFFMLD